MNIKEMEIEIEKLEKEEITEHTACMAGLIARDIENTLWQKWTKDEAYALADRARKVQEKFFL